MDLYKKMNPMFCLSIFQPIIFIPQLILIDIVHSELDSLIFLYGIVAGVTD